LTLFALTCGSVKSFGKATLHSLFPPLFSFTIDRGD
jgi:hypothetical protein